jgi:hypothetical protein
MNNYLAVNETGTVDGKHVQCIEINEADAELWEQQADDDVCKFYNCAFRNIMPCFAKCINYDRPDEKNVYYKLIINH